MPPRTPTAERRATDIERILQVLAVMVLVLVGVHAMLEIRAHYRVWRYAPPQERLPD